MIVFVVMVFLASCGPPSPTVYPELPPIQKRDGGASCAEMCEHIGPAGLNCPEGRDTPGGATCVEVCESTLEGGLDLHPECVIAVERCEDVDRASQGC